MDKATSIKGRIETLKELHKNGITTVLFMSPMFPYITDFKSIILETKDFVDEYWFENLNLRGEYKYDILKYIKKKYPEFYNEYNNIYLNNDKTYWIELSKEIEEFCKKNNIKYKNYFYHEEIVKK
jgi:DNA repair photolyase